MRCSHKKKGLIAKSVNPIARAVDKDVGCRESFAVDRAMPAEILLGAGNTGSRVRHRSNRLARAVDNFREALIPPVPRTPILSVRGID